MSNREYPATQFTFINVFRAEDGRIESAELWSGVGDIDPDKFLLDIYHAETNTTYGYREEVVYGSGPTAFVDPAQVNPEVLVASWVTNPPSEPTDNVSWAIAYDAHVEHQVDMIREGLM